jgi:hypothetical protein
MFEFEFLNIVILTRMSLRSICFNRSIAMITKELSLSSSVCPFFRYIFVRSDCTTEERARSQQLDCRYLDFGENFVSIKITVIRTSVPKSLLLCAAHACSAAEHTYTPAAAVKKRYINTINTRVNSICLTIHSAY